MAYKIYFYVCWFILLFCWLYSVTLEFSNNKLKFINCSEDNYWKNVSLAFYAFLLIWAITWIINM